MSGQPIGQAGQTQPGREAKGGGPWLNSGACPVAVGAVSAAW